MNLTIDLQIASDSTVIPDEEDIHRWVLTTLEQSEAHHNPEAELSIRVVDSDESQQLNGQYRHKHKPTNVLSFPADLPEELQLPLLGDLVICAPVVEQEAVEQGKTLTAHWAHMVTHGTLHLLGFDHIDDLEAEQMEALETRILLGLGFPAPYEAPERS